MAKRDYRRTNLLTPRDDPRRKTFPPLTAAQQALAIQYRPMAHLMQRRRFGQLAVYLGQDEIDLWVDLFLCEAAQRYDPDFLSPKTGKPCYFSTFMCRWVNCRLLTLANNHSGDPFSAMLLSSAMESHPGEGNHDPLAQAAHSREPTDAMVDECDRKSGLIRQLDSLLGELTDRQRFVLQARHGIIDGREWTYREIAAAIGVSKARTQQVEFQAMDLLQRRSRQPDRRQLADCLA